MSKEISTENNFIGNGSTVLKYILVIIATRALALAAAHGINLPMTETQLAEILACILGFIFATIDAKHPNNIFNNIWKLGIAKISETEVEDEIDTIDPASDYERDEDGSI